MESLLWPWGGGRGGPEGIPSWGRFDGGRWGGEDVPERVQAFPVCSPCEGLFHPPCLAG